MLFNDEMIVAYFFGPPCIGYSEVPVAEVTNALSTSKQTLPQHSVQRR